MILGLFADPVLRASLWRAASSEEDVIVDPAAIRDAVLHGFPRLIIHDADNARTVERLLEGQYGVTVVNLSDEAVTAWNVDRRKAPILRSREDFATERIRVLLRGERPRPNWVDHALRDLSKAAGAQLPPVLRGFGRRVMEFPARYDDLHGFCDTTGLSRGALKARFRRRGLHSPSIYLRWFRVMAAAHVLRDSAVTTLHASHRLGFTTDGNFCRAITTTSGITPTELRSEKGWQRLVVLFSRDYLGPDALDAWSSLDPLFHRRRVA
jgi:AraC-like DNA-binding protein